MLVAISTISKASWLNELVVESARLEISQVVSFHFNIPCEFAS